MDHDPLSAEAEIVRVRDHYHDLNEKVGLIAVATATSTTKLEFVAGEVREIKAMTKETHDLIKPLVEKVGTLQLIVYGTVGLALSSLAYALLSTVVKAWH